MTGVRYLAAGSFALLAMTSAAHAVPVTGSDSIIAVTVGTSPHNDLQTILNNGGNLTFSNVFWAGGSGSMSGIPSGTTINNPITLTVTTAGLDSFSFSSSDGTFVGAPSVQVNGNTYNAGLTSSTGSVSAGNESLGFYLVGTFTPAGDIAAYGADSMSVALTVNENGITGDVAPNLGSFSASFSVATPAGGPSSAPLPANPVPEPASLALLGAGLLGLSTMKQTRSRGVRRRLGPIGRFAVWGYIGRNDRVSDTPQP